MHVLKFIICFLLWQTTFSQSKDYEIGKIVSRIVIAGNADETFALYLPEGYDKKTASAIVFIFDPSARGARGLMPFISSAERYNYILVCSNNSKNGPYQSNFDITNRLFSHVFSTFNIDEKQIYTAGFSGGSRLASSIAVLTGSIQGVIACGAGFSNQFNYQPSIDSKFSFVGLVGDEDMNYQEMFKAKKWLDKFKVDNTLFTYEDGHSWPPEAQIERAFSWLELQAYKRNIRKKDTTFIKLLYKDNYKVADSLSEKQPFNAATEYDRISENYDAYVKLDSIHDKRDIIKKSKAYKQDTKRFEKIVLKEELLANKFLTKFTEESFIGESRDYFKWWDKEFKKLDDDISKNNDSYNQKMSKRIRFRLMASAFEASKTFEQLNRLDKVLYCNTLQTKIYPERPYWHFLLAETYAKTNDAKNTRINLKIAIDKGFENLNLIKNNPLFLKFKDDRKFNDFLSSLK